MASTLHRGPVLAALAIAALGLPAASASAAASTQTLARTESSLRTLLKALPGSSSAYIREAATQTVLATRTPTVKRVPASVTKLFTTSTALMLDGPATTLDTELRMSGTLDEDGVLDGDLIVQGAGDPAFRLDQITALAAAAKKAGIKQISGALRADLGPWTSDQGTPVTNGAYNREIGGRLGALVTLRGFASGTVTDPARQVLVRLSGALRAGGLKGVVRFGAPAPAGSGTALLGTAKSPTLAQLAAATNAPSDNFFAEMLLRGVGARHGAAGTTAAGVAIERTTLAKLGVRPTLYDGSGLSRSNRVAPTTIVRLLDVMASRPEGSALRNSLALAGSTGTLAGRMRGTAAAGRCRAKTGTLSNVSALAGWCTTLGRRTVSFAIVMNNVSVPAARLRQDKIAATIAGWTDPPVAVGDPVLPTTPATSPTTPSGSTPGGATIG